MMISKHMIRYERCGDGLNLVVLRARSLNGSNQILRPAMFFGPLNQLEDERGERRIGGNMFQPFLKVELDQLFEVGAIETG
jgi:hypothetical protein